MKLHTKTLDNCGSFWSGGCAETFERLLPGLWRETSQTYRGVWEDNTPREHEGEWPPWPIEQFREATRLMEPPDGTTAIRWNRSPKMLGSIRFVLPSKENEPIDWLAPELKLAGRAFAAGQRAKLKGLGFTNDGATAIMRAAGPGVAVAAAEWVATWLCHGGYAEREQALRVVRGTLAARACGWRPPAYRLREMLVRAGAPEEGVPTKARATLLKFLSASEQALLKYFTEGPGTLKK